MVTIKIFNIELTTVFVTVMTIHFEKSMNSSDIIVWTAICFTHVIGPYLFEVTVTGESYLKIFNDFVLARIN